MSGGELSLSAGAGVRAHRWVCGVHGDGADGDFEAAAASGGAARCGDGVCDGCSELYEQRYGVRVGPGLGFEDTFAMVVRGDDARRLGLKTISDAVKVQPPIGGWVWGMSLSQRPDGLRGLRRRMD